MVKKSIPSFPGYFATDDGRIWSGPKKGSGGHSGRFLNPRISTTGYVRIKLYRDKKHCYKYVHQLVLEAFVGKCPAKMEGCHYDGDKTNNRVSNLRWDTRSNNVKDSARHGIYSFSCKGEKHPAAKLNNLQVRVIKHLLKSKEITQVVIGKLFGVVPGTIKHINCGQTWTHIK